jgi:hypothetical protein
MITTFTVRFLSGRVEKYEVELYGGPATETRLEEFTKNPTIVLKTETEVVIIPATAIESISLEWPGAEDPMMNLPNIRKGKRLK